MIKKNKIKNEYVTHADLAEQTQIILSAIDGRFNKVDNRFNEVGNRFNHIETKFDELKDELKTDINNSQISLDGYVKSQEDFKQEFVIMKEEIRQIKRAFKQKLGVEIRAF